MNPDPKYAVVLFDFDGTLANSFPWFLEGLNAAARRYRFKAVEPADFERYRRMSHRELLASLGIPKWKIPFLARFFRKYMAKRRAETRLFDGVAESIRDLSRRGVTLGIVSSNSAANVEAVLGPELSARFTHFECGVSFFGKERRLRRLLKKLGVAAGECLYVGDEPRDIEAARAVGMAAGAVAWGYFDRSVLEPLGPSEVFRYPVELAEKI